MKSIHSRMLPGHIIAGLGQGREASVILPRDAKMKPGDFLVLVNKDRKIDDPVWTGAVSIILDVPISSEYPGLEDGFMLLRVGTLG